MKERMENDLMERFDDAEILYRDCEQKDALFSRFAEKVSELLGIGRNHPAYAETSVKTMNLALASFNQLNLAETLGAISKELRHVAPQEETSIFGSRTAPDSGRSALP
jgi:hypothetical protein